MKNNKNKLNPHFFRKMSNGLDIALMFYKTRLNPQQTQKGNTLLIGLGFGLLVMLLGGLAIAKANNNKINATSNEKAAQAQAVTDIGTARITAFLSQNPTFAEYKKDLWPSVTVTSGTPEGSYHTTDGAAGNKDSKDAACQSILDDAGVSSNSNPPTGSQVYTDWSEQAVNTSDYTKGGFKIVNYNIEDTNGNLVPGGDVNAYKTAIDGLKNTAGVGNTFAFGRIEVEAGVSKSASNTSTNFTNKDSSQSQVFVRVPLIQNPPGSIPVAGLWLGNQSDASSVGQYIDANVMVSDCNNVNFGIKPDNSLIISSAQMPSLPPKPGDTEFTGGNYNNGLPPATGKGNGVKGKITLPSGTDQIGSDKVYHYLVDSLEDEATLTVTTDDEVRIYLTGDMEKTDINCTGTCTAENFHIYGYKSSGSICLNGGIGTKAFIFALDYSVGVNGGSGTNFEGAIWAKQWNGPGKCGSNSNHLVVTQTIDNWNDIGLFPQNLPSTVGNITSRERQDIGTTN